MKTLNEFIIKTQDYTCLEDFVLTTKEWNEYESGTRAFRVKTYNSNGNLINREYVLRDIDNMDEVLNNMQEVGSEYYTDTCAVIKK
jgi:hypothetical protein